MNYRVITRKIAKFYLFESSIIMGSLLLISFHFGRRLFSEVADSFFPLAFFPVVWFCFYSMGTDKKLLKSTEIGTAPDAAMKNCKSSLKLTKMTFVLRLAYIIAKFVTEIVNIDDPEYNSWTCEPNLNHWEWMFCVSVVLFPLFRGFTLLTGNCLPNWQKLFLCRKAGTLIMCILVVMRGVALYCAIKYNQQLEIEHLKTVAAMNPTRRRETTRSDARTSCPEAGINIIPLSFIGNTNEPRNAAFTQIENIPLTDLPSYEDVIVMEHNQNPPSYASIFNSTQ